MKPVYLVPLAATLALSAGCKHKVELPQDHNVNLAPNTNNVTLGPGHKRIELRSPKNNKKLLDIDVWEDEQEVRIRKDAQDVRIRSK